jgi:hypothetical protein
MITCIQIGRRYLPRRTGGLACTLASGALHVSEGKVTEILRTLRVTVVVGGGGAFLSEQLGKVVGVFAEQIIDAAILAIDVGVGGESFVRSRCGDGGGGGRSISGVGLAADRNGEGRDSLCVVLWWCEYCTGLWYYQK